ncbi:fumarylacetoacetate hydrolase family protein [Streptomyces sp. NPDC058045]|uniref:fumarylacetoacetate hydrolase family protein n=1 Tax=Streptomyces sp. NPDC058045 TaxID=3346311 RepID=UPI0036E198A4
MRLATLRGDGRTSAARIDGETCTEIPGHSDLGTLLAHPHWQEVARNARGPQHPLAAAEFATLLPHPSKVLCTGLNYRAHISEMGRELPTHPTLFAKFADTLTGPYDPVVAVPEDPELDWEGELAVVIGEFAHHVDAADAHRHIAGYTVANDISMRGWQNRTTEWLQGKIWARSTPVGPYLVTPDGFDRDQATLRTTVNGAVMQQHPIADLLFTPEHLIAYISTILPLRPGDLVLTGTPGGVGHARTPRHHLQPGDHVTVSIDGLGHTSTPIVAPSPGT